MRPIPLRVTVSALSLAAAAAPAAAQPRGEAGLCSDVTVAGSILEPEKLDIPDDAELIGLLRLPDGFRASVFARDLVNPRMLAVSGDGTLYATRRSVGDVVMMRDGDGDGRADGVETVAGRAGMHGIAIDGDTAYLATNNDVYTAAIGPDGRFGELRRIINDLPDVGQHPNRTLAVGPDGMLYISVGSTCNACAEGGPESATILRATPDGASRSIFASGLRNTIGFGFEPATGQLYGWDHGIDWLGDEAQVEELNLIGQGKRYGWPYVYGMGEINPQDNPPEGISLEDWAGWSTEPLLGHTAHSAPMQMAFYTGSAFPESYRGDAFVAMRGSWNRRPPSGYEVVRVDFEDGRPVGVEPFVSGFLVEGADGGYGFAGRPTGLAMAADGGLFLSDDSAGVIYKITYAGAGGDQAAAAVATPPVAVRDPAPSRVAIELVEARGEEPLAVASSFAPGGEIPVKHAADGDDASPTVSVANAPEGTRSFVLVLDDPDAAAPKPFVHWLAYDIPADAISLREGLPATAVLQDPAGLKQGTNSMGSTGYTGPKPPVGDPAHRYHLQVFALDSMLGLDPGARREEVLAAMAGHVLAEGEIVGTFERPALASAE